MKKLLLFPLLVLLFSFVSDSNVKKEKLFCGWQMDASNTNSYAENCLVKVKVTDVSTGQVNIAAPALWGHDQYQNVLIFGDHSIGLFNITVAYQTDNTSNAGYVYLYDPGNNVIGCQAAAITEDMQNITFYNVFLNCGGAYHIGVKDTSC